MRGVSGILNPGKPFTTLSNEVHGVIRVICEGHELEERSYWYLNDACVEGKPTRYAINNRRLYVWPIPDRAYRISLHWSGEPDIDVPMFDCTPQWMDLYEKEYASATAQAGAVS